MALLRATLVREKELEPMIYAIAHATSVLAFCNVFALAVADVAMLVARRGDGSLFARGPWSRLAHLLRYRSADGNAAKRQRADVWLSLGTTVSIFVTALMACGLPIVYADAHGKLSPVDAALIRGLPVGVYLGGIALVCVSAIGFLAFIYGMRCSIRASWPTLPVIALRIIGSRAWVVLAASLIAVTVALVGKVAFYQFYEDPLAKAVVWVDSFASTLSQPPLLDVQVENDVVDLAVTLRGKRNGTVIVTMDQLANPKTCSLIRNEATAIVPRMQPSGWIQPSYGPRSVDYATRISLARNDRVTLHCAFTGIIEEPSGSYRRLRLQTAWFRRIRKRAGIANAGGPAAASLGSLMVDGEDISSRTVPAPALAPVIGLPFVAMPPMYVIDWRDARAQVLDELYVLVGGALIALALAMLVESLRRDLDALQHLA